MTEIQDIKVSEIVWKIKALPTDSLIIVADQKVWDKWNDSFSELNDGTPIYFLENPESQKNLDEYNKCIEWALEKGIHRKTHLIAIGVGATSDFAGFVASSLLRGISWSIVPTTLLSMIDACIGGKVGVNSIQGKNLIGAFHIPQNIYFSPEFLKSLPDDELKSGKGELLKYGLLDRSIFDSIMSNDSFEDIIKKCREYKIKITSKDLRESGERKVLNLGHTVGHAFERTLNISHGMAVLLGIKFILDNFNGKQLIEDFNTLMDKLNINLSPLGTIPWDDMFNYVSKDKKVVHNGHIDLVVIEEIGKPMIKKVSLEILKNKLKS